MSDEFENYQSSLRFTGEHFFFVFFSQLLIYIISVYSSGI